jgi:hypothetical protein
MLANKAMPLCKPFTGTARSHKELPAHRKIISTSANTDPVGAGHACEQDSALRRRIPSQAWPVPTKS